MSLINFSIEFFFRLYVLENVVKITLICNFVFFNEKIITFFQAYLYSSIRIKYLKHIVDNELSWIDFLYEFEIFVLILIEKCNNFKIRDVFVFEIYVCIYSIRIFEK